MPENIQVVIRVRPAPSSRIALPVHWSCNKCTVRQLNPETEAWIGSPHQFNHVFGAETQNHLIFKSVVKPLIDSAMDGVSVSVLAYGQSESGKTRTMMGNRLEKELGIVQLAVERIFDLIDSSPDRAFHMRCSYFELGNGFISDLLNIHNKSLEVYARDDHCPIPGLEEVNVKTRHSILELIDERDTKLREKEKKEEEEKARMNRMDGLRSVSGSGGYPTGIRDKEGRSFGRHTIFRLIVESVPRTEAFRYYGGPVKISHIDFVDFAASDGAASDRFGRTELPCLRRIITQLSKGEKRDDVEFEDSTLSSFLCASIGGNARTLLICNVTPTVLDETTSTLEFGSRAKLIRNQPRVNEISSDKSLLWRNYNSIKNLEMQQLVKEKEKLISELRKQLVVSQRIAGAVNSRSESSFTSQPSSGEKTFGFYLDLSSSSLSSSEMSANESSLNDELTPETQRVLSQRHSEDQEAMISAGTVNVSITAQSVVWVAQLPDPTEVIVLDLSSETSENESSSTVEPTTQTVLSDRSSEDVEAMVSAGTVNMSITEQPVVSNKLICMGRTGCVEPPVQQLACSKHYQSIKVVCSRVKCLIPFLGKEQCGCVDESVTSYFDTVNLADDSLV